MAEALKCYFMPMSTYTGHLQFVMKSSATIKWLPYHNSKHCAEFLLPEFAHTVKATISIAVEWRAACAGQTTNKLQ